MIRFRHTRHARRSAVVVALCAAASLSAQPAQQTTTGDKVQSLTRDSRWTLVTSVPMRFPTYHPQGMVKIGEALFVSSVEVRKRTERFAAPVDGYDRDAGAGVGHVFKTDLKGTLLADITVGEGTIYHPGGMDYDGRYLWLAVAEYRPNSRSIVYRIDPDTMKTTEVFRFDDHIGALVHDVDGHALHGVSWGSRRFYRWPLDASGRITNSGVTAARLQRPNPSHYVDYQDCKYAGRSRMLCTGVSELRPRPDVAPFRLGGLDLIDLRDGRPVHQVPLALWTPSGLDMTHNPAWLESTAEGLRAYFMPEDDASTLYVYQVTLN